MISKSQINKRIVKKTNPAVIETIKLAKKNNLLNLAKRLSSSRSNYKNINLDELNKIKSDKIIVIGKVLGSGEVNKKISIAALSFSEQAREKLKKAGCEVRTIVEEIRMNSDLKGVEIIE